MDPFNEVKDDAYSTIHTLEALIRNTTAITPEVKIDYSNNIQELNEIYKDLEQAVNISANDPQKYKLTTQDVNERKEILQTLNSNIDRLKEDWNTKLRAKREVTTMSNRISQDGDNPFSDQYALKMSEFQQQQVFQEQDLQLDAIHETMQNLNKQAQLMGGELEDQAMMLDNLDEEMDNTEHKMQRGLKAIEYVLIKNKDKASDWCIGLLVVALCVLLIIVIAV